MKRRILSLAMALVMALSMLPAASLAAEARYDDTAGHWAEDSIERWSEYNIVEGDNGYFHPNRPLTRGEMAKILANALGLTDEGESNPFDDVPADAWYTPYVLRCYVAGIMQGTEGHAYPESTITRQETMTLLGRALAMEEVKDADLSAFPDAGEVADWAKGYVAAMTQAGIVNGVGGGLLAPVGNIDRASIMAILDRSVAQYINAPGTYELVQEGLVLVAAGDVTLTGESAANVLVTPAATGASITFENATLTGSVTVQADDVEVVNNNSELPEITALGEGVTTTTTTTTTGGGGGGGGGGGSSSPSYTDLIVAEAKTVDGTAEGAVTTYQSATITAAVANGTVVLKNLHILGDLTIRGGGKNSIKLENCTVDGDVIMDKAITDSSVELPRLYLINTPIQTVVVKQGGIIEAADSASTVASVEASSNVYVNGSDTVITKVSVYSNQPDTVIVEVDGGQVDTVEAKSGATVTGANSGQVSVVVATAPVSVDAATVRKVEIPAAAPDTASVAVSGTGTTEVEVNTDKGADITTSAGATVEVSTQLDTAPTVTVDGTVTHVHTWSEWTSDNNDTHTRVCASDSSHVETENHAYAGEWTYVDENTHKDTCTICSWDEVQAHIIVTDAAVAATCTTDGKTEGSRCSLCNTVLVAQTVVAALGHDFENGEMKYDADGHWRVCARTDCEETDAVAAHTYPTSTNCEEATACTTADCQYTKAAGEHAWSGWSEQDETYHARACGLCGASETEAHSWDEGEVTTEPTETTDGVKTYTCTVEGCGATKTEAVSARNMWFVHYPTSGTLYLTWSSTLDSGEYYGVRENESSFLQKNNLNQFYFSNIDFMSKESSETVTLQITKGAMADPTTTEIGTTSFELVVEDANTALTVAPQEDGTYKVSGGAEGYTGYFYRLKNPDGEVLGVSSTVSMDGVLNQGAPYENCVFEVSQFKLEFDGAAFETSGSTESYTAIKSVTVTKPTSITITADDLPTAPAEERTVTAADELQTELCKGGTVKLGADIEATYLFLNYGAPATLDLNGYTITSTGTEAYILGVMYGKELTITGTTEGSGIQSAQRSVAATYGAKLKVNGGTYSGFYSYNVREVTLTDVTVNGIGGNVHSLQLDETDRVSISGGTYSIPYSSTSTNGFAIYGAATVDISGITVNALSFSISRCDTATVKNSAFNKPEGGTSGNLYLAGTTATLENVTCGEFVGVDVRSTGGIAADVTIKSGTYGGSLNVSCNADSTNVSSTLTIESGTFTDPYTTPGPDVDEVCTLDIKGGTFNFDPSAYVDAANYTVTPDNADSPTTWTVSAN